MLKTDHPGRKHTASLLGMLGADNSVSINVMNNPENASKFSYTKWAFMLDAPFEVSEHCCSILKKYPVAGYYKESGLNSITGINVTESSLRFTNWLRHGCNGFDTGQPKSTPMAFWTNQDVCEYIYKNNLKISSCYGEVVLDEDGFYHTTGMNRTGCFACGFGLHREKEDDNRLRQAMLRSNPKIVDWALRGGRFSKETRMWEPYQGVGMWFVLEWMNKHGGLNIWYPDRELYIARYMTSETKRYLDL